jgi:hypothetical protein
VRAGGGAEEGCLFVFNDTVPRLGMFPGEK